MYLPRQLLFSLGGLFNDELDSDIVQTVKHPFRVYKGYNVKLKEDRSNATRTISVTRYVKGRENSASYGMGVMPHTALCGIVCPLVVKLGVNRAKAGRS